MASKKILIIEDDEDIVEMISYNLRKEGYRIISVSNGEDTLDLAVREKPDLVILDLMLPGMDGLEVCKSLRQDARTSNLPIIMLTAKSQETDKIVGLEVGADDYMTKPFSPRELLARIKAILRRYEPSASQRKVKIGELSIDSLKHKVEVSGKAVFLTPTEFKLLEFMAKKPGVVLSRDKILDNVFGYESEIYDRTVDSHMKSLRKKLGKARNYIETIRGIGYKFKEL